MGDLSLFDTKDSSMLLTFIYCLQGVMTDADLQCVVGNFDNPVKTPCKHTVWGLV